MPTASMSVLGESCCIPLISHTVIAGASGNHHSLFTDRQLTKCDNFGMADKNAGPNHLKAWREYRRITQEELASRVRTSQNMIAYLESGARGLSAKWLRRLAPALNTSPGHLLDHDPNDLPSDIIDIWIAIEEREKPQALRVLRSFRTRTDD